MDGFPSTNAGCSFRGSDRNRNRVAYCCLNLRYKGALVAHRAEQDGFYTLLPASLQQDQKLSFRNKQRHPFRSQPQRLPRERLENVRKHCELSSRSAQVKPAINSDCLVLSVQFCLLSGQVVFERPDRCLPQSLPIG